MARKRIGEVLLERGAITEPQLQAALEYKRQRGGRIGEALVAKGYLTEETLCAVLGETLGMPVIEIPDNVDWAALHLLKANFCESHEVFPLRLDDHRGGRGTLTLAVADPLGIATLEEVAFKTGCKIQPVLATRSEIRMAILRHYHRQVDVRARRSSRMTLVRPGGDEEEVDTDSAIRRMPVTGSPKVAQPFPISEPPTPAAGKSESGAPPEEKDPHIELTDLLLEREQLRRRAATVSASVPPVIGYGPARPRADWERLEKLERKFWALMRLLAKKGLLDKEEFLAEFDD